MRASLNRKKKKRERERANEKSLKKTIAQQNWCQCITMHEHDCMSVCVHLYVFSFFLTKTRDFILNEKRKKEKKKKVNEW